MGRQVLHDVCADTEVKVFDFECIFLCPCTLLVRVCFSWRINQSGESCACVALHEVGLLVRVLKDFLATALFGHRPKMCILNPATCHRMHGISNFNMFCIF